MRYLIKRIVLLLSALLFILSQISTTTANSQGVSFAEIMPNPDGTDTKTNEYLMLKNYSGQSHPLAGDKICNISNDCYLLKGEIAAGACLKINRTDFVFTLHNDKEQLNLFDTNNNILSQVTIGTAPSGQAWLCSESYCQWGEPRETCDYSDIVDPASLPSPEENNNENTNDNSESTEIVENKSVSKPVKKIFQIFSKKDWVKVKKEMNQKNLLSLTADVQGNILVPLNIVKANTFYLLSANNLVAVNIYSSRQTDFGQLSSLYQAGAGVLVNQGYLKKSQGTWQLGIGKDTRLKIKHKPTSNNSGTAEIAKITGKILRKSGQYFYIEDQNDGSRVSTVYIPSVIWDKYLEQENIGSFPQLVNNKIVTASEIKGKNIEVSGIVEISGNTQRVIVTSEKDIRLEKTAIESSKPESKEEKPDKAKSESEQSPSPATQSETPQNPPAEKHSIGQILSQKLSWLNLWTITIAKIKSWEAQLF